MNDGIDVRVIAATDTHDLRRRVLRDGAVDADLEWRGDDETSTIHLGVVSQGRICGVSTWLHASDPLAPELRSVQLRGMATDPTSAGRGFGRAMLQAGIRRARDGGFDRVWAEARVTALGFYEGGGMIVTGPVFATAATGLPHRHVHVDLG